MSGVAHGEAMGKGMDFDISYHREMGTVKYLRYLKVLRVWGNLNLVGLRVGKNIAISKIRSYGPAWSARGCMHMQQQLKIYLLR